MATIACTVTRCDLENDDGFEVEGVVVRCTRCDLAAKSYGTSDRSVRRSLLLLRQRCGLGEENYYVAGDAEA